MHSRYSRCLFTRAINFPTLRISFVSHLSTPKTVTVNNIQAMSVSTTTKGQYNRTTGVTDPVWIHHEPYSRRPTFEPLKKDITTQTCIIGAGISGLSTAYELVKRQQEVVLLEAREVLSGETGRTSGHLSSALDDEYINIEKKHSREGAKAAAESHAWAIERVGQISQELGIDCEYHQLPAYRVSQFPKKSEDHAKDVESMKAEAKVAKELGLNAEYREGFAIKGWKGTQDQRDALVFTGQASFHPTKYLNGLMRWLKEQDNFKCYTNTRVMLVEETGTGMLGLGSSKGVHIQTELGHNVNCLNAVEATAVPLQKLSVIVELEFYRTCCVAIKVPKGSIEDCLLYDTADPYHYMRLTKCDDQNDYIIVGGGDHKVGQEETGPHYEELESWARERFPQCTSVDYRWSGQIFEPVDHVAFIGPNQGCDHIYIVTGDSGNGLTHGVLAGKLIADEIAPQPAPGDDLARPDWTAIANLYSPKRIGSILKSAPTMIAHDAQINFQYKRFLESDIQDIEDLAPGTGGVMNSLTKLPIAVYKDEHGNVTKRSALCPHLHGVVCWNQAENSWDCPVHGSRFSPQGLCVDGPAKSNLPPA